MGWPTPALPYRSLERTAKLIASCLAMTLQRDHWFTRSTESDPKVYAVASSAKTSFDKTENDLRDKKLLTFSSEKLTSVELE